MSSGPGLVVGQPDLWHNCEMRGSTLYSVAFVLLASSLFAPACRKSAIDAANDASSAGDTALGADAQCRAVGETCSSWSDCCSGVCGQGTCLGQSNGGGGGATGGQDASSQGDGPERVDAGPTPWRPAACDQPELGQIPNTDQPTVASLVLGKWFDCDPLSMFGTSDDIGVEIVSDGNWYKLYWNGTDAVRGVGFGKLGTWTANTGGICCTVSLNAQGAGGGVSFFPAFATSPKKMQVSTSVGIRTTLANDGN